MKRFTSLAALTAIMLTSAACGDDRDSSSASASTGTQASNTVTGDTVAGDAPQAIISLSPTHTEILFAIGAGDQVIAVDDQSNYPAEALEKPHDLSGFEPNVEAIAALQPDLVVIGDDFKGLAAQLEPLGIATWVSPAPTSFDEAYSQIEQLGAATGRIGDAAELVAQMQADIEAAIAAAPVLAEPATFYHELDNTLFSVTSNTFIGHVYEQFNLVNIADGVAEGNDYPQLSAEYVVSSNPDLIFLADAKYSGESPETVAARAGWDAIAAVQHGGVIIIDDDIASRWGPRLVDFVEAVSAAMATVPAA
ncbi:MAG: ABC transporter substrate-binding protein [Actinomycetota bacterium]|nr:ABC transporter substrate-binding protein [Actinomycetota bacterium]